MVMIRVILPFLAIVLAAPTQAADATPDPTTLGVSLFLASCVGFAGDSTGLRSWVSHAGYPEVPADRADEYLEGMPGAAYDASRGNYALVLVSEDSGSCSVVIDQAKGSQVIAALDKGLREANVTFTATDDTADPLQKDLNNREYAASAAGRSWHMLVSTAKDPAGGEAVLTTNP